MQNGRASPRFDTGFKPGTEVIYSSQSTLG